MSDSEAAVQALRNIKAHGIRSMLREHRCLDLCGMEPLLRVAET